MVGIGRAALLAVVGLVAAAGLAAASIGWRRGSPVSHFDPHWKVIHQVSESAGVGVWTNGFWSILYGRHPRVNDILVDEQSGRSTRIRMPSDCRQAPNLSHSGYGPTDTSPSLRDTTVFAQCSDSRVDIYRLAANSWRTVRIAPACDASPAGTESGCFVQDAGSHWLELSVSSSQSNATWYQNLATGALERHVRYSATKIADLDSPSLTQRICQPLVQPRPPGTIRFSGKYALVSNASQQTFLERCGSSLRVELNFDFLTLTPRMVTWSPGSSAPVIDGIFLPSMKRFTLRYPPWNAITNGPLPTISRIYAQGQKGSLETVASTKLPSP